MDAGDGTCVQSVLDTRGTATEIALECQYELLARVDHGLTFLSDAAELALATASIEPAVAMGVVHHLAYALARSGAELRGSGDSGDPMTAAGSHFGRL